MTIGYSTSRSESVSEPMEETDGENRFSAASPSETVSENGKSASPFTSRLGSSFKIPGDAPRFASARQRRSGTTQRVFLCSSLILAGVLGAALIGVRGVTRYSAMAEAMLPYSASASAAPAVSSLGLSVVQVALPGESATPPRLFRFSATAGSPSQAISRVDAAAQSAVRQNSAAWAQAAQSAAGSAASSAQLGALPLARVTSLGEDNSVSSRTRFRLDKSRAPFAVAWLTFFAAATALCASVRPKPQPRFAFRSPAAGAGRSGASNGSSPAFRLKNWSRHSTGRANEDAPRIADLPQMASVHLARDVSAEVGFDRMEAFPTRVPGSDLRPVLSNASDKLWMNFASRADLASAMSAAAAATSDMAKSILANDAAGTELANYNSAAQAVLEQAQAALALGSNTEILFTRLTRDARGSRAAMLAIARLLAQRGKQVVLVDLDFAAGPEAQAELGLPGDYPGAAEILSQRAKLDDCLLMDDDYPALTAIPASLEGTVISHEQAARLLQSAEMLDLLDKLREGNHLVLIHGPAAEDAARALGSRADAALLVVGQEPTDREHRALPDALAELNAVQANIVGRIAFDDQIV